MPEGKLLPGKFIWFELVTPDAKKAQAFYAETLGWKTMGFPMGSTTYDMILTGATPDTMVGGYVPRPDAAPHWLSYVSVEDVDAAARAVTAAGGTVVEPPTDIQVGRRARVVDPQGATICLFTRANGDPPDVENAPYGAFVWNELHTPDPEKALAFYGKALGFEHKGFPTGPAGTYYVVSKNGVDRGGVTHHMDGATAPHWLPYMHVEDADATVTRAKKAGGVALIEPADIPGTGRFAVLRDPTGAAFAILKPFPRQRG